MHKTTPTRANVVVLKPMLNLIPRGMINRHALATGVEASLAELIGLCGCLVRIEIDLSVVSWLGPSVFRNFLCVPEDVHDRLIAAGLEMGANSADWSTVAGPVPLTAFRRIEFTVEADPPKWIPWPGIRPAVP